MLKEWPLVAFTILAQTAVGLFVVGLTPFVMFVDVLAGYRAYLLTLPGVTFCLMAAATLVSFLHLHHPLRAFRALVHVRTSWLSREILFELLFMALVAAEFFLVRAGGSLSIVRLVYLLAGLAGLLFLLSMVKIYMLGTLPFWNQAGTPLSFLSTSFLLGALTAGVLVFWVPFFVLAIAFTLFDLVGAFLLAPGHGLLARRAGAAIRPPGISSRALHSTSLGLEALGLISIVGISLAHPGDLVIGIVLLALFSLTILGAQVVRRFLFYGLGVGPG